ncbi:hypothetical protein [Halobacillus massiliensis]|uniref:hypothetical protein n=1 Tax=Halobacillus massiliensis TaxID=1926286 RepID=UPI0009E35A6E|nr:hypothetical protein [Halobacillus massiliensis]
MCTTNCYELLNDEKLVGLYYSLLDNIFNGSLSLAMFNEIDLLELTAANRGMRLSYYSKRSQGDSHQLVVLIN